MSASTRVASGVPTGGQFAAADRAEAVVHLLPLSLEAAVPERGTYDLDSAASEIFERVSIARVPGADTFRVTGTLTFDVDTLPIEEHAAIVDAHLERRYGAALGEDFPGWERRSLEVATEAPCDADVTSAVTSLDRAWGVQTLRADLDNAAADFRAGIAAAIDVAERAVDDHAYGVHDDEPDPTTCPECAKRLIRLDDATDVAREGKW